VYAAAIPIGLPLLVLIGYLLWRDAADTQTTDEGDDDLSEEDDASYVTPLTAPAGADAGADNS
jgi:hypothetical protein